MNDNRREILNKETRKTKRNYVLYWMQQSHRIHFNHALNEAVVYANMHQLPLVVYFGLTPNYPEANERHYAFMLEGLKEVEESCKKLGITFVIKLGNPDEQIKGLLKDAQAIFLDKGYLKYQKLIRKNALAYILKNEFDLYTEMIDTDLIVPVSIASQKVEYGAYTIRPKIKRLVESFRDYANLETLTHKVILDIKSDISLSNTSDLLDNLSIDHTVKKSRFYDGGYSNALKALDNFVDIINQYPLSNDPSLELSSKLSLYLHFGQISSLEIYERLYELLMDNKINGDGFDAFVEQLIIRRELAYNYVYYQEGYDEFYKMTEKWAYETMLKHIDDIRPYIYSIEDYETFNTHDECFNAAMKEMVYTGYMHNYMRMYWAKKIIEWSNTYEEAYKIITYLNNKYFIDGRDANSYTGIAWCFGKHDRAWIERPIFGKLRYMNKAGLYKKFDIEKYIEKVDKFN